MGAPPRPGSAFLAKVKPTSSIIEVGGGQRLWPPDPGDFKRPAEYRSKIYRTDTNGNVEITTDGQTYSYPPQNNPGTRQPPLAGNADAEAVALGAVLALFRDCFEVDTDRSAHR